MRPPLDDIALDRIFRNARTQNSWRADTIADAVLRKIYDLAKMGPTSANCSPGRFIFVVSKAGKEKLKPALSSGNLEKTMAAPVTAIVGYDTGFSEFMPELFPHEPSAQHWFKGIEEETAFRNGTLQAAYLMIAARALGLDCGPMSGFDKAKVNTAFWPEGRIKANFLCNIGVGDDAKVFARSPRLAFERACAII
ncbi:MAG: malonic semialdehyde reductase [Alphaproteobacteria bacterium]|nr:malonic semialdehyde reductase [Alphaproteobacteria bacterium]